MKKLSMADNGFLQVERPATPMHVGGVTIHKLPKGVNKEVFFADLMEQLYKIFVDTAPFNQKLKFPPLKLGVPSLVTEPNIDMDYHTRHTALPAPGTMEQLNTLIGQLHSVLLERDHPLWTFRLIEGLEGNRFALYFKMHHSTIDGIGAMNLMKALMSDDPSKKTLTAPPPKKKSPRPTPNLTERLEKLRTQAMIGPELGGVFKDIGKQIPTPDSNIVPLWYSAPKSILNVPIKNQRRFAVKTFALDDFKALAKARGVTINDVVLSTCAGALRRHLKDKEALPERSLTCCIPVSIRPRDGPSEGNAISSLIASLGTQIEDPLDRLAHVHRSTKEGKAQLNKMSKSALEAYTLLMGMPFIAGQILNVGTSVPSPFNILISNVPASDKRLYLCGTEMEALYGVNLIFEKQTLNITCTSYVDTLDFSFIACRKAFPDLEKLASYLADSVEETAKAAGVKLKGPKKGGSRKATAPRKPRAVKAAAAA